MALPKGMPKPQISGEPIVFDLDDSPLSDVAKLPKWVAEIIYKSETYQEKVSEAQTAQGGFTALDEDDGELPF